MDDNVVRFKSKIAAELEGEMALRIKAIVYEYTGSVSLVSAIGVLEVVKQEVWRDQ